MLEMGQVEQDILPQILRSGGQIPERILNAPTLTQGLEVFLQAFFDLDTERNHSMGLQKIPWSKIVQYAEFKGLGKEQTEMMVYFIKRMDSEHLKRLEKKQESFRNANPSRPGKRTRK